VPREHVADFGDAAIWDASHGEPFQLEWADLVQAHDDRNVFQASPDELPATDIHCL
jgi:hypothetical protein